MALALLVTIGSFLAFLWFVRDRLRSIGAENIFIDSHVLPEIAQWQGNVQPDTFRVAVLGDSVLPCADPRQLPPGSTPDDIGQEVGAMLAERGIANQVVTVTHPAFRAIHFYYLLARVLGGSPDAVVIEINPRSFSDEWARASSSRFGNLSRELGLREALRIRDELAAENVTLTDPLVYRFEDRAGMLWLADGIREGGRRLLQAVGEATNERLGLDSAAGRSAARESRFGAGLVRRQYGADWTHHPMAGVLSELLLRLHAAGVRPLFYVTPINVQRIDQLGLTTELSLDSRLDALRSRVGAGPTEWLDLHALLPSAQFRDWTEHIREPGCRGVARAIADHLALGEAQRAAPPRSFRRVSW